MPRSTSSPPPSYRTTAPYTGYGTLGSPYCNDYPNDPAATETSSLWTGTTYPRRSSRRIPLILCGIVALLLMVVIAQNTGLWSTLADDIPPSEKAAIRRSWRVEKNVWAMEKGQWAVEQAKHQEEVAMWERERKERQEERDAFEREKEEWARQRLEEERHNKEIEWRRRGAYWTEPWATSWQCSGYGTRPYSAHLIDLPGDVNWLEACMNMPIKINNQWIDKPNKCQRDNHNTWGTWSINFGESQCATYWDTMYNRGCSPGQTGMRRYEARLMNLRHGDDWDLMCRTTPATISGVHFDSPLVCEDKNGRTGVWDVPDGLC